MLWPIAVVGDRVRFLWKLLLSIVDIDDSVSLLWKFLLPIDGVSDSIIFLWELLLPIAGGSDRCGFLGRMLCSFCCNSMPMPSRSSSMKIPTENYWLEQNVNPFVWLFQR